MMIRRVVSAYLAKKARVPKVPERLIHEITSWAEPYLEDGKGKLPVSKKFELNQADLAYGKLKVNPYIFTVRIEPPSLRGTGGYWSAFENLMVFHTKGDGSDAEDKLTSTLRHEFMHLLQSETTENVGQGVSPTGRTKTEMGWDDGLDEKYYQGDVEYKPHIHSNAIRFYNTYKHSYDLEDIKGTKGKDLLESWIARSEFFQHLKGLGNLKKMVPTDNFNYRWDRSKIRQDSSPIRYRRAVRDFYILVKKLFESHATKGLEELLKDVLQRRDWYDMGRSLRALARKFSLDQVKAALLKSPNALLVAFCGEFDDTDAKAKLRGVKSFRPLRGNAKDIIRSLHAYLTKDQLIELYGYVPDSDKPDLQLQNEKGYIDLHDHMPDLLDKASLSVILDRIGSGKLSIKDARELISKRPDLRKLDKMPNVGEDELNYLAKLYKGLKVTSLEDYINPTHSYQIAAAALLGDADLIIRSLDNALAEDNKSGVKRGVADILNGLKYAGDYFIDDVNLTTLDGRLFDWIKQNEDQLKLNQDAREDLEYLRSGWAKAFKGELTLENLKGFLDKGLLKPEDAVIKSFVDEQLKDDNIEPLVQGGFLVKDSTRVREWALDFYEKHPQTLEMLVSQGYLSHNDSKIKDDFKGALVKKLLSNSGRYINVFAKNYIEKGWMTKEEVDELKSRVS